MSKTAEGKLVPATFEYLQILSKGAMYAGLIVVSAGLIVAKEQGLPNPSIGNVGVALWCIAALCVAFLRGSVQYFFWNAFGWNPDLNKKVWLAVGLQVSVWFVWTADMYIFMGQSSDTQEYLCNFFWGLGFGRCVVLSIVLVLLLVLVIKCISLDNKDRIVYNKQIADMYNWVLEMCNVRIIDSIRAILGSTLNPRGKLPGSFEWSRKVRYFLLFFGCVLMVPMLPFFSQTEDASTKLREVQVGLKWRPIWIFAELVIVVVNLYYSSDSKPRRFFRNLY